MSNLVRGTLAFLIGLTLAWGLNASLARADEWSIEDMNRTVDSTNFVVDRGCSGTVISIPERLILTNYHCIDDLVTSVDKELTTKDGYVKKVKIRRYKDVPLEQYSYDGFTRVGATSYVGEIVAEDQGRDLAVIRVRGNAVLPMASPLLPEGKSVTRGERVYVVGNPAMNYGSVVEGIVSSVNRVFEFPWTQNEKLPMIQFSGGIFGGNSGGALYNAHGQLIGVPAAGFNGANFIGLAVPVDVVRGFLKDNCLMQPTVVGQPCAKKAAKEGGE